MPQERKNKCNKVEECREKLIPGILEQITHTNFPHEIPLGIAGEWSELSALRELTRKQLHGR